MASVRVLGLAALATPAVVAASADANPLGKVMSLMDDLKNKIVQEGEAEAKAYHDFFEWCDDASINTNNAIKTATGEKNKLEALIAKSADDSEASAGKVEELAGSIAGSEGDLKSATELRTKEAGDFAAEEANLVDIVSALSRAIGIVEKEMTQNAVAFAQVDTSSLDALIRSLSVIVDAASLSVADKKTLSAFLQSQASDDDDDAPGAPAAATYKSHSGGILDTLEDMQQKSEDHLSSLRKAESNAKHNYNMLSQSLKDQITVDTKHMKEEQASKAASDETKAIAEGDLAVNAKALANLNSQLANAHSSCLTTAADHEATVAARKEELSVIAKAKEILQSSTSGASGQTYSLLQVSNGVKMQSASDLAQAEVVNVVKQLARDHHSAALAQLASRIAAVMKFGAADPFAKVKGLIQDMIIKLENEAQSEATEKAWCDEQLAKTQAKKDELDDDISKLTSKIDVASSRSASLKGEVKALQGELAALAQLQAEMDQVRTESHANYVKAKSELEQGLEGVRNALTLLRNYYGGASALLQDGGAAFGAFMQQPAAPVKHSKSAGAGDSIVGILEVVESDFAKNLAAEESEESDAADDYEKTTQENSVEKTVKDQDVKYKTQEFQGLDKAVADMSGDRDAANAELSAVMDYYGQVKDRCIAKPETYEERQAKRQAEIEGLKQALSIIENETALVQRKRRGGSSRFLGVSQ